MAVIWHSDRQSGDSELIFVGFDDGGVLVEPVAQSSGGWRQVDDDCDVAVGQVMVDSREEIVQALPRQGGGEDGWVVTTAGTLGGGLQIGARCVRDEVDLVPDLKASVFET